MPTNTSPTVIPWAGNVPYGKEAAAINQFMGGQALQQYSNNLPGYANAVGQRMENTQSMLEGDLPQDVVNQIAQQSAERGIGGGGVSPNSNAAYLRALGLNSLDMMQQGSQNLSAAINDTPVAELWNPASLWVPTVLGQQERSAARAGSGPSSAARSTNGTTIISSNSPGGFGVNLGNNWSFGNLGYSFL